MEVQRSDDSHFLGFGQAYITATRPGVIKAWYRHTKQVDQITAINGLFKLVLFDARPESATRDKLQEIILGELAPKLVQIPAGIWHGFKNIGENEAFLLHLNTVPFDFQNPDEERLPMETKIIPYGW
jgi:dTDP-4-dehydrorhamnose 3,5-epimerase